MFMLSKTFNSFIKVIYYKYIFSSCSLKGDLVTPVVTSLNSLGKSTADLEVQNLDIPSGKGGGIITKFINQERKDKS